KGGLQVLDLDVAGEYLVDFLLDLGDFRSVERFVRGEVEAQPSRLVLRPCLACGRAEGVPQRRVDEVGRRVRAGHGGAPTRVNRGVHGVVDDDFALADRAAV